MKQLKYFICALCAVCSLTSCEDLFETESNRQIFDPQLSEKTDSMFYMLGIMKGVQRVADQYVLTNEMRGDLVATNAYTETSLKQLASFNVDYTNKYDSAYLYYRIVNNCNYFIAHRKDSALMTGSRYVNIPEIAEAHAVRAWAYLQLVKTYGRVPFYTDPLVTIGAASHITDSVDIHNIVDKFEADLTHYSGTPLPNYGEISAGFLNSSTSDNKVEKKIHSSNIMLPVDVVLGDLYLESNQYEKAAKSYFNYIKMRNLSLNGYYIDPSDYRSFLNEKVPSNMAGIFYGTTKWQDIFSFSSDSVTYIPLASNRLRGLVTDLPRYFGYDFYSTDASQHYILERQIEASPTYIALSEAQDYYYKPVGNSNSVLVAPFGDLRRYAAFETATLNDSTFSVMNKFNNANIPIYRGATVYLRLAEALNRWGYPELAFAILKDGINDDLAKRIIDPEDPVGNANRGAYIRPEAFDILVNELPFFYLSNNEYYSSFTNEGIHGRGTNYAQGIYSPYQLDAAVSKKLAELQSQGTFAPQGNLNDTINAMEDLICDEMALELAFEGNRFGDLTRFARHKNATNWYGSNYGSQWLATKLAFKRPRVDLREEKNWFLPFQ